MEDLNLDKIDFTVYSNTLKKLDSLYFRNKVYYELLYCWMKNRNNNKTVSQYLLDKGIKKVAIYGAGNLGQLLCDELKNDNKVIVKYIIDKNTSNTTFNDIPVLSFQELESIHKVDSVIVTPIYAYDSIKVDLNLKHIEKIICIDEIVFELSKQ